MWTNRKETRKWLADLLGDGSDGYVYLFIYIFIIKTSYTKL